MATLPFTKTFSNLCSLPPFDCHTPNRSPSKIKRDESEAETTNVACNALAASSIDGPSRAKKPPATEAQVFNAFNNGTIKELAEIADINEPCDGFYTPLQTAIRENLDAAVIESLLDNGAKEIGRASCRERV